MWVGSNVTDLSLTRLSTMRNMLGTQQRLLMECAKTLTSTMLFEIVMQTTKTGVDKCKAGLHATLIIKIKKIENNIMR